MNNEFNADLITLISDDGQEIEFEILDIIENDEGKFYVLYPFYENPADAELSRIVLPTGFCLVVLSLHLQEFALCLRSIYSFVHS